MTTRTKSFDKICDEFLEYSDISKPGLNYLASNLGLKSDSIFVELGGASAAMYVTFNSLVQEGHGFESDLDRYKVLHDWAKALDKQHPKLFSLAHSGISAADVSKLTHQLNSADFVFINNAIMGHAVFDTLLVDLQENISPKATLLLTDNPWPRPSNYHPAPFHLYKKLNVAEGDVGNGKMTLYFFQAPSGSHATELSPSQQKSAVPRARRHTDVFASSGKVVVASPSSKAKPTSRASLAPTPSASIASSAMDEDIHNSAASSTTKTTKAKKSSRASLAPVATPSATKKVVDEVDTLGGRRQNAKRSRDEAISPEKSKTPSKGRVKNDEDLSTPKAKRPAKLTSPTSGRKPTKRAAAVKYETESEIDDSSSENSVAAPPKSKLTASKKSAASAATTPKSTSKGKRSAVRAPINSPPGRVVAAKSTQSVKRNKSKKAATEEPEHADDVSKSGDESEAMSVDEPVSAKPKAKRSSIASTRSESTKTAKKSSFPKNPKKASSAAHRSETSSRTSLKRSAAQRAKVLMAAAAESSDYPSSSDEATNNASVMSESNAMDVSVSESTISETPTPKEPEQPRSTGWFAWLFGWNRSSS